MNRLSPNIEIIEHFDSLINRVDIDIEESIGKYSKEIVLSQLKCFQIEQRNVKSLKRFSLKCFDSTESEKPIRYQTVDQWPESMKVIDYLNRIRERTISELRKAQEDTLSHYKLNSSHFKSKDHEIIDETNSDEIRSEIFNGTFFFQVLYKPDDPLYSEPWGFNLYTFVTDFYMSHSDINLLETLINYTKDNKSDSDVLDKGLIFDEKLALIGLLQDQFFRNLQTEKFPSHMIISRKRDLLKIQEIVCSYCLNGVNITATSKYLSNIEILKLSGNRLDPVKISIEGPSSLKYLRLEFNSLKQITLRNLSELRDLDVLLPVKLPNNSDVLSKLPSELCDYLPNIQTLALNGYFSKLNLDQLINLKALYFSGYLMDDFNFDLFKNICNQLEEILIVCRNMDDKILSKLFYGHKFPYLLKLSLARTKITRLEKKLLDRFPMLQNLNIYNNKELGKIDRNAFSNLKHLISLYLADNCIESIDKSHFSYLTKLEILVLNRNPLKRIKEYVFSDLKSLRGLCLNNIQLTSLSPKSFAGLNNLEFLLLENNKFIDFDFGVLDNLRGIQMIDLSGNPFINKEVIDKTVVGKTVEILYC